MSDLFAWFQNYLNLSKLTAVTVPGMVVAFALILILGPIPCRENKDCPFCAATLTPVPDKANASAVEKNTEPPEVSKSVYVETSKATLGEDTSTTKTEKSLASGFANLPEIPDPIGENPGKASVKSRPRKTAAPATRAARDADSMRNPPGGVETKPAPNYIVQYCNGLPLQVFPSTGRDFRGVNAARDRETATSDAEAQSHQLKPIAGLDQDLQKCSKAINAADAELPKTIGAAQSQSGATEKPSSPADLHAALDAMLTKISALRAAAGAADPSTGNAAWVRVLRGTWGKDKIPAIGPQFPPADGLTVLPLHNQIEAIGDACDGVPEGIVPNSLVNLSENGAGEDVVKEQNKAKKASQDLMRLSSLLLTLNGCNNQLQIVSSELATAQSSLGALADQNKTDLTGLSSALVGAQQTGERLYEADLRSKVHDKTAQLQIAQREQTRLTNATNALKSLTDPLAKYLNLVNVPTADASPAEKSNAVVDVFSTIEQNLLKFLLFSLILGQILDPIQRGAVSFFGPRRDFFDAFNKVYGQGGDGEFRYGERRLEPWVSDDGLGVIQPVVTRDTALLQPNIAARFFLKDRNIYDKNYAIGAGYITQSEAKAIEDDYYGQSQLTSGLILPMLIFSICIAIRLICCSKKASAQPLWSSIMALAGLPFGIVVGGVLMLVVLWVSSAKYGLLVSGWFRDLSERRKKARHKREHHPETDEASPGEGDRKLRIVVIVISCFAFIVLGVLDIFYAIRQDSAPLDASSLLLIIAPALSAGPLWIAGLDRLHKFYSELEARIAGNILRLQSNTEQKFVDLISDPVAACAFKEKVDTLIVARESLKNCLKGIPCDKPTKEAAEPQEGPAQVAGSDDPAPTPDPQNPAAPPPGTEPEE